MKLPPGEGEISTSPWARKRLNIVLILKSGTGFFTICIVNKENKLTKPLTTPGLNPGRFKNTMYKLVYAYRLFVSVIYKLVSIGIKNTNNEVSTQKDSEQGEHLQQCWAGWPKLAKFFLLEGNSEFQERPSAFKKFCTFPSLNSAVREAAPSGFTCWQKEVFPSQGGVLHLHEKSSSFLFRIIYFYMLYKGFFLFVFLTISC